MEHHGNIEKDPSAMDRMKSGLHGWINSFVNVLTVATVIFYGGKIVATVNNHETRLTIIETIGTPSEQRHIAMDDERVATMKADILSMRNIVAIVSDMRGDLKVIESRITSLQIEMQKLQMQHLTKAPP